jgi:hypothetical protein
MSMHKHLKLLAACVFASPLFLSGQTLFTYEAAIAAPADAGGGPALWYQNADSRTGTGLVHMASTGSATNTGFRLGGQTFTDYFGNTDKAFGLAADATASGSVSGSTNFFMTGPQGSVSFLFKTGSDVTYSSLQSLFRQGTGFELILLSNRVRLSYSSAGTKTLNIGPNLTADTWYYAALKWDTTKPSDDLTWYLGVAGSETLASGTVGIDVAGGNASIEIAGRSSTNFFKDPMQQFAVWTRELSDASVQQQFTALAVPEPGTYALLLGIFGLGYLVIRRRPRATA